MPSFFERSGRDGEQAAIQRFWTWWAQAKDRIAMLIDADDPGRLPAEMSSAVRAVHRDLAWEVGPGLNTKYQLCISGEGSLEQRALAGRVIAEAPHDAEWVYYPARQAKPDLLFSIQVGANSASASDARFHTVVDSSRERLDTTVWHPIFPTLPDQARKRIALLFVDSILGEDDVEKWLRGIDVATAEPQESVDPGGFRVAVRDLESAATGDQWIVATANRRGRPVVVSINSALKPLDHLDKPVRLDVWIEGRDLQDQRMPSSQETAAWSDWEDLVETKLSGFVTVGRVTGDGKRRITWHVADGEAAKSVVSGLAKQLSWKTAVSTRRDPEWKAFKADLLDE